MSPDDVAYAIRINPVAQRRLQDAAGIAPLEPTDEEYPEPDLRRATRSLTGLDFDDLVKKDEIVSRRAYVCNVCSRTFTLEQFRRVRHLARIAGEPNPFTSSQVVHEECSNSRR